MGAYKTEILRSDVATTSDATPTDVNFPNLVAASGFDLAAVAEVTVCCVQVTSLVNSAMYQRRALFTKGKVTNITMISTVQVIGTDYESTGSMNATIKALPAAGIAVTVTGIAATDLIWTVFVRMTSGGAN